MSDELPPVTARHRLDPPRLQELRDLRERGAFTPREAVRLAADLGALAVWALADDVLELAAGHWAGRGQAAEALRLRTAPPLPRHRGSGNVLCALDDPQTGWPLRDSFFLPLRWRRRNSGSPDETRRLPPALQALARRVLRQMHGYQAGGNRSTVEDWELTLNVDPHPEHYDLSGWAETDFTAASGWAALAAGWLLAGRGGLQDATVAASAAWNEGQGLACVGRLRAKAAACRRHGVQTLFVAAGQSELDSLTLPHELLRADQEHPLESLRPLLQRLLVPPAEGATLADRSDYYQDLRTVLNQEEESRRYYVRQLLSEVAANCRRQLPEAARHLIGNCRIVIPVSWSPELVDLTTAVFQPVECLPLCTAETQFRLQELLTRLRELLPDCRFHNLEPIPIEVRASLEEIAGLEPLVEFVRSDPNRTIIDLKPGPKTLTAALELLARRHRAWAYILQNSAGGLRDIHPGQESPFVYRPE